VGHAVDTTRLASDLRIVLGQLMRRLRVEHRFSLSQGAVLGRLDREGTRSIGDLAIAERVRPQSMTQTISDLETEGLIARQADPADGRRTLVELTEQGIAEAKEAGRKLKAKGLSFDIAFTSVLKRAQHTLDLALTEIGQTGLPITRNLALNERDYGDLSGLNKDEARERWGAEKVHAWRRSYDAAPPGGESLRDTAARVLPYYIQEILPRVLRGQRVLVTAHGNSLRALVMVLDRLGPKEIVARELATGVPMIYRLNADATVAERQDVAA